MAWEEAGTLLGDIINSMVDWDNLDCVSKLDELDDRGTGWCILRELLKYGTGVTSTELVYTKVWSDTNKFQIVFGHNSSRQPEIMVRRQYNSDSYGAWYSLNKSSIARDGLTNLNGNVVPSYRSNLNLSKPSISHDYSFTDYSDESCYKIFRMDIRSNMISCTGMFFVFGDSTTTLRLEASDYFEIDSSNGEDAIPETGSLSRSSWELHSSSGEEITGYSISYEKLNASIGGVDRPRIIVTFDEPIPVGQYFFHFNVQ